ncbi:MAG TPA: ATP-grasp domain-containing protein [Candidatus Babeliales bacterium]|nr:ATP-grasp domain-containing protein [Candidatus Babeliales bacterium]
MKHVLMIGGRDHTINKFKHLGVSFSVIQKPDLVTDEQTRSSKKLVVMDYKKLDEVVQIAKVLHQLDPFDAIISFAEYGMLPAAICSRELGLPSNDIFPIETTRDKLKMRALLQEVDLGTVKFKLCNTVDDVREFFAEVNFNPIIIKPSASAGSRGISFISKSDDIESAWKWTTDVGVYPVIAEEYIEGDEYSVETLSLDGNHEIAMITEKVTTGYPNFIETGHQVPARLDSIIKDKITHLVISFLNVIKQKTGPTHTEIKISKQGPKIIESQTRIGGDQIWEMTEMVSGIDQMSETICKILDLPMPVRTPKANSASIRFFAYENMKLQQINNLESAKKLPGVYRVSCKAKPGDEFGLLKSSDSRQGYILAIGETVEAAIFNAETAIQEVQFI